MKPIKFRDPPNHEERTCSNCRFAGAHPSYSSEYVVCQCRSSKKYGMAVKHEDTCRHHEAEDKKTPSLF